MRIPSNLKFNFLLFYEQLIGIDKIKIDLLIDKYNKVKELTIGYLFVFAFSAYVVIAHGYWKANYLQMVGVTFISLISLISIYFWKRHKTVSSTLASILFIYIPIANILIKDVFFLLRGNPLFSTIFLHTHFILLLFISFGGLITKPYHIVIVGFISVVWIWVFTIISNNPFLWSLVVLDSVFFIGISLIMYFVYSSILTLAFAFDKLGRTISNQNTELNKLLDFKDRMLNMIIHDIKNPISRILSAANKEIIQKEEISKPAFQILLIVENILDVYKLEDSKMQLKISTQILDDIIKKATSQVEYLLDEKNISIIKRLTIDSTVDVDADLLERVIVNLLTNAIKFSKSNSSIDIRIVPKKDRVRVEIIDKGEGIASENIDHIFEKYYQGSNQSFVHAHSTGMGLTFCKLAVETHGGTIGAESILNQGSTIWFELPVKLQNEMNCEEITVNSPKKQEQFNSEEKIILKYKMRIANLPIYQTGEILNIFKTSSYNNSPGFVYWKNEIIKASMTGDVEYYNQLKEIND